MNETAAELRRSFIEFFVQREHRMVPSSPLVPVGDASLLFTTAGMVQFKPLYGIPDPEYRRAVSYQKCLRATDIENVGHTIRHHTFFEMLGNFSFGDYFKEEAIAWAWEYTTGVLALPAASIWVSVHNSDDKAARIWERATDLPAARIVPLGDADNFWGPAGATGACGPCSEMYWDLGAGADPSVPEGALNQGDRYIEFWNLVFPQYEQQASGQRVRLTHPGIDTGMGLERLTLICQGATSPYETDLFRPLVRHVLELAGRAAMPAGEEQVAVRVIADHVRGLAFALAEGLVLSNEGRGYVLRRLLRRASRRGRALGIEGPFLHRLAGTIIDGYGEVYPELRRMGTYIESQLEAEEERFARTLDAGVHRFEQLVAGVRAAGGRRLAGNDVFLLYDTFGFPVDLTTEMAREQGLEVDRPGFESAMAEQRRRARAGQQFRAAAAGTDSDEPPWTVLAGGEHAEHSRFLGYDTLELTTRVCRYRELAGDDGAVIELVLEETPFYAESGGQVGDRGVLEADAGGTAATGGAPTPGGVRFEIFDTRKGGDGAIIHRGRPAAGDWRQRLADPGAAVTARVDREARLATMRNHTATHLLHAALRAQLGAHVQQHGSLVAPERLRFDFSHFAGLDAAAIAAIEDRVNDAILRNTALAVRTESYAEATERGAMALFGEKYGSEVRTVEVPGTSLELCGGTHCRSTGEIGLFKITAESAIGAGVRRIEAVTGHGALAFTRDLETRQAELGGLLGVAPRAVPERLGALLRELETLKARFEQAESGGLEREIEAAVSAAEQFGGHRLVVRRLEVGSVDLLRKAGDAVRDRLGSGAAVLGAVMNGKVNFLAVVTDDLIAAGVLRADELVRSVARVAGGSGGGKPHQALAGGKQVDRFEAALEEGRRLLRERLQAAAAPPASGA